MFYFAQISFLPKDFLYFCNVMMKIWYKVLIWFICIWWVWQENIVSARQCYSPASCLSHPPFPLSVSPFHILLRAQAHTTPTFSFLYCNPHCSNTTIYQSHSLFSYHSVSFLTPPTWQHLKSLPSLQPFSHFSLLSHPSLIITTSGQPYP